jgi:hypothetical protein
MQRSTHCPQGQGLGTPSELAILPSCAKLLTVDGTNTMSGLRRGKERNRELLKDAKHSTKSPPTCRLGVISDPKVKRC